MSQFAVYRNANPDTQEAIPLLLDIQNHLLSDLDTCVVVPLCRQEQLEGKVLRSLTPCLEIEGEPYVMLTPQLAGIPKKDLGPPVAELEAARFEIVAALDFLITGV